MAVLKTVYVMAFTPAKMEGNALIGMCKAAGDMLAAKDPVFARHMAQVGKSTPMKFSNQLFVSTMHTPQSMTATFGGWLKNEKVPFTPAVGQTFFPHGMRDAKGAEHFILFYFVLE